MFDRNICSTLLKFERRNCCSNMLKYTLIQMGENVDQGYAEEERDNCGKFNSTESSEHHNKGEISPTGGAGFFFKHGCSNFHQFIASIRSIPFFSSLSIRYHIRNHIRVYVIFYLTRHLRCRWIWFSFFHRMRNVVVYLIYLHCLQPNRMFW